MKGKYSTTRQIPRRGFSLASVALFLCLSVLPWTASYAFADPRSDHKPQGQGHGRSRNQDDSRATDPGAGGGSRGSGTRSKDGGSPGSSGGTITRGAGAERALDGPGRTHKKRHAKRHSRRHPRHHSRHHGPASIGSDIGAPSRTAAPGWIGAGGRAGADAVSQFQASESPARRLGVTKHAASMVSSAGVLENLDRFVSLTPLGAAAETARRMAFPLTLMILVFVFLIAQNAFDKRDPKLAMAASSQKETMLTFS